MAGADPYTLEDAELDIAYAIGLVDRMSEAITKNDSTDPPNLPAAGLIHHSFAGHHKYASADGNYYNTGRLTQLATATPQTISSTTPATVTGMSCQVAAATYVIEGFLSGTVGGTSTTIKLQVAGPAITSMNVWYALAQNNPGGATYFTANQIAISTLAQPTTVNQGNGSNFTVHFRGAIAFSAAGTMSFQAAETTNLQTWTVNYSTFWHVLPVT